MSQDTSDDRDVESATELAGSISLPYKVLGDIANSSDGIGVLGRNTATSGVTRGVEGRVDSPNGYGLATPDDARIEGILDTDDTDFVVLAGTTTVDATNVVLGHTANDTASNVVGGVVGGGGGQNDGNQVFDNYGTIAGGTNNTVGTSDGDVTTARFATVGGGDSNTAGDQFSTVGGGTENTATALYSTIGGGIDNVASGQNSTVGGGWNNEAQANYTTIGGGAPSDTTDSTTRDNTKNVVYDNYGTVGGGGNNQAGTDDGDVFDSKFATVGGGMGNRAAAEKATVGGGGINHATKKGATVGGGAANRAKATFATVAGGGPSNTSDVSNTNNHVYDDYGTVGGGGNNQAGKASTSGTTNGVYATVPGGRNNTASGKYSFAAGRGAEATNDGAFVWSDSTNTTFTSSSADQFLVDADGGVGIGTASPPHDRLTVSGTNSSTTGYWSNHLVGIETSTSGGDVLALRNTGDRTPGVGTNYITFFDDRFQTSIGAVQGNGTGIEIVSGNEDLAEYFPKADVGDGFEAGDVVGLRDGEAVADPTQGQAALVVSGAPMVTGNVPDEDEVDEFVCLALTGQVPVRVREAVAAGVVLVAGAEGRAVPAGESARSDLPVVGLTLSASEAGQVRTLVGGHGFDAGRETTGFDGTTDDLEAENAALRAEIDRKEPTSTPSETGSPPSKTD